MTTPKLWPKLVDDAVHRHMSRWRLGEIAVVVREAATAWAAQVETMDAELIKYIDAYIFMERDRDRCARERDAYKAERDTLLEIARAAQAWRATWAILDDAAAAVERRQKARRRLFAALDTWAMGDGER